MDAINNDWRAIKYITIQTKMMQDAALEQSPNAEKYFT